ncbi:MAG: restriction endonuclease subunit S [Eubacterium sp.]
MAKKAKDSALSMEERLEQALIPNWDEPYKLPDNWCWTKIGIVANLYRGVSYKKHEGHSEKGNNDCLVMRGGNILEGEIDTDADKIYVDRELVSKEQYVKKYDIIIVSSTGSTKVIGRAGISFADYNDVAFGAFLTLVRPNEKVYKPYISYYFQGDLYRNRMRQLASGVNINNIRNEYITDTPIPLPPFDEQQRIVDLIKSLFAKLDEAKEKAQKVVDGFETRKVAILHKVFEGKLTEKWREEHAIGNKSWVIENLSNVCVLRSGTTIPAEEELEFGQIPYIKISDMNLPENSIQITTSSRFANTCPQSHLIPYGSTIFPKRGGAILTNKKRFVGVDNIIADLNTMAVIPIPTKLKEWYCYYWMLSVDLRKLYNGANVPQINNKDMIELIIPVPSLEEQDEIIRILDELLSKEQHAKETAETVIEQIDTMKKAILARAFRGELGTNDPTEESAVELLKQII